MLLNRMPDLQFSISHTTRPPRDAEKNGRDYYFVSHQDFQKKIQRGEFIEWARICNDYYGTALDSIRKGLENGGDLLLELDVQGAATLRKNEFPGVYIFILPPSLHELETRLKKRATESEEKIRQRLEKGKEEIKMHGLYDYI
ncbi:MAG: guanylate kinase, partial [Nitrospinaceae bacterium]